MIFEEVVLHNFGVYQGRRSVQLDVNPSRPIVLVGAMNGSGKTTFLDAMQLALYGKSARCTGRERVSYSDYLASMVSRDAPPTQGAGIEFAFRTRTNGRESTIRLCRTWSVRGQNAKESLEVHRDGVLDRVASERWQEFVEDFMPSQIADLFFFDGEKIEALADPTRSASLLRVGVHSLLGIDLVESLIKSLQQVERKRKVAGGREVDRARLDSLQENLSQLEEARRINQEKLASLRTLGDGLSQQVIAARAEFKRAGGELYERHDKLAQEKHLLERQWSELEERLRDLSAGVLPLCVASELLSQTNTLASRHRSAREQTILLREFARRDDRLLEFLRTANCDDELVVRVAEFLDEDRQINTTRLPGSIEFPDGLIEQYQPDMLRLAQSEAERVLSSLSEVRERLSVVEGHLVAVPSEVELAPIKSALDRLLHETAKNELQLSLLLDETLELERKIAVLAQQIERESDSLGQEARKHETAARVLSHSAKARGTLTGFREQLLRNNLDRLQMLIGNCFQQLLRKQTLVSSVIIQPELFEMSVVHPSGKVVPAHRLSAGERQLLAVATLWALSQASGRHLPAVIDTPLSRLDSKHRGSIVKNYFPRASHQVILLSTDEEVVGRYYNMLDGHIGRQYLIEHDEVLNSSVFREGTYFGPAVDREAQAA